MVGELIVVLMVAICGCAAALIYASLPCVSQSAQTVTDIAVWLFILALLIVLLAIGWLVRAMIKYKR